MDDPVLAEMVREAESDDETLALVLHGSRSVGHERPDSDYDVLVVRATELEELRTRDANWFTDGLVQGRVLVDKTGGELDTILARLGAAEDVVRPYDAYLNALVRGKSAARRGDELGARLHAADSVRYLAEALAGLDGKRPRFHDRLSGTLGEWEPRLLAILRKPDVDAQLALAADVRALMESRGIRTHDDWEEEQLR
jgi:predicted nucleotidyltransferase